MVQAEFIARALISSHDIQEEIAMKKFITLIAAAALLAGTGSAFAQPRYDDHNQNTQRPRHDDNDRNNGPSMAMHGPSHADWRKGGHIGRDDWRRGARVDYRSHHLRTPPRGYEWREVDGNYVLAAAATGLIASVILANR